MSLNSIIGAKVQNDVAKFCFSEKHHDFISLGRAILSFHELIFTIDVIKSENEVYMA
jgi:hypothetical protein